ncbi:MAG: amidohydrolase [Chloroflexi bacterium]|nr:amidohydrolase [Chloroflexota bacterium]
MRFIDVDGHILEPSNLWVENMEPEYRDRAMRFVEDDEGLEGWSIDGTVNGFLSKSHASNMATIGRSAEWRRETLFEKRAFTWEQGRAMNPGACDPKERVKLMDEEGIDISFLFPSLGLSWMGMDVEPRLGAAYNRVYNDWISDFCHQESDRLVPCVLLPWTDVGESVKELRRTTKMGLRAVMTPSVPPHDVPYSNSQWDPLWAEFQEQDIPLSLHPASGGTSATTALYPNLELPGWWGFTASTFDVQLSFLSFFREGVFDRFPNLKVMILESGCAWMPYLLGRMDEKFSFLGFTTSMKLKPSEYFYRQCWIDMDPDDELGLGTIRLLGADKVMWAYDYPHSDSALDPVKNLKETLKDLSEQDRQKVAGGNAIALYKLPVSP